MAERFRDTVAIILNSFTGSLCHAIFTSSESDSVEEQREAAAVIFYRKKLE